MSKYGDLFTLCLVVIGMEIEIKRVFFVYKKNYFLFNLNFMYEKLGSFIRCLGD
jgi:hypothetical protein